MSEGRIPVSVITGFLGSGKTTLLARLLQHPAMGDAAVIINEFGEIGLDHHLVESSRDDVMVMSSGCLCCTIRTDLVDTLRTLHRKREQGEVSKFRRVLVETTGLADPAPILHTLMNDPLVSRQYALDGVITTVDALHGRKQLDDHFESLKQAAVADRLLLTKVDAASPEEIALLRERLQRLNPGAPLIEVVQGEIDPAVLFDAGLYDPATKSSVVTEWLRAEAFEDEHAQGHHHHHHNHDVNRHDARIHAHCLVFDCPLDWRYFSPNLASLVSRHAEKLLRVKGILNVQGEPQPVVVHGVQHQFQRMRLAAWPDEDRRSKLVLIARDLDRKTIEAWLRDDRLAELGR
ncbi:CobW family GTP-binding protein [Ramlibacter sp.]|uniref:CobW family GTP-binding protein n=1 Tax=Ramlibacter sp. TaxID=1917967 RepID=UPI003D0D8C92